MVNALLNVVEGDGWSSLVLEVIGVSEDDEVIIASMKYVITVS